MKKGSNEKNKDDFGTQRRITSEDVRISMSRSSAARSSKKKTFTAVLIVAVTCFLALSVVVMLFFKVENVEIYGNVMYDTEDIFETADIIPGTSFLAIHSQNIINTLKNEYPAIRNIKLSRKLPSTVELHITESAPAMYITVGEFFYTLDENLVVLEKMSDFDEKEMLGLTRIYLPDVSSCISGEYLVSRDADIPEMVKKLYGELSAAELPYEIKEMDFTDKFDIKFILGVKYTVKLGSIIDCDIKLEFLRGILEELSADDVGTIDLSDGDIREAIFSRS